MHLLSIWFHISYCQVFSLSSIILPTLYSVNQTFTTRHYGKCIQGLQYPPCATSLNLICEFYTTRDQLNHKLDSYRLSDVKLLMLERVRMIDTDQYWGINTLQGSWSTLITVKLLSWPSWPTCTTWFNTYTTSSSKYIHSIILEYGKLYIFSF